MIARWLIVVFACVFACTACGDNLHRDDLVTAVSGSRLALQKYRYDDGTEQAAATEFYDTQLHVRCTPRPWSDGAVRCIPVADDAAYSDPACTTLIGLGRTIPRPTHFIAYDARTTGNLATHVFRSGAATAPITQYYELASGACIGPIFVPPELMNFFEVGDEVDGASLVELHDAELGDQRLGLRIRETDDGLRVPFGLRDRELDVACVPRLQGDGRVVCEPSEAAVAMYFRDPACSEPVVATAGPAPPVIARLADPIGCTGYHRVGREVSPPIYQRDGGACTRVDAPGPGRWFSVEAPIELPALGRSLEDASGRRLRRVILDPGGLRFFDDRLFDTAIEADCRPRPLRDGIRCFPASLAPMTTVFLEGCAVQVRVAEIPRGTCEQPTFATSTRPFQVRAIGDLAPGALFRLDSGACQPYTSAPGSELRALGPPLDLATLLGAIYYGERASP